MGEGRGGCESVSLLDGALCVIDLWKSESSGLGGIDLGARIICWEARVY